MLHTHFEQVESQTVQQEGAQGVSVRWVIGPDSNAPNFHLRVFAVAPGGFTPLHAHPWEHEVFVLAGRGTLTCAGNCEPLAPGEVVYIPGGEEHQFTSAPDAGLQFICLIPVSGSCAPMASASTCGGPKCSG